MTNVSKANDATVEQQLQTLTDQARTACATTGSSSSECVDAWQAVEEAQSTLSQGQAKDKSSLERLCEERPDAAECRIYDV